MNNIKNTSFTSNKHCDFYPRLPYELHEIIYRNLFIKDQFYLSITCSSLNKHFKTFLIKYIEECGFEVDDPRFYTISFKKIINIVESILFNSNFKNENPEEIIKNNNKLDFEQIYEIYYNSETTISPFINEFSRLIIKKLPTVFSQPIQIKPEQLNIIQNEIILNKSRQAIQTSKIFSQIILLEDSIDWDVALLCYAFENQDIKILKKINKENNLDCILKKSNFSVPLRMLYFFNFTDDNRQTVKKLFPQLFSNLENYPSLSEALTEISDINIQILTNETLLHLAARLGNSIAIQALLGAGAAVDALNNKRWTPLHFAAEYGHKNAIDALLEARAAVNPPNNYGQTPLHRAAVYGCRDAIQALLDADAAADATDINELTPLHFAVIYGRQDAIQALIQAGAAVDSREHYGQAPLHLAIKFKHPDTIQALIQAGAAVDARDHRGQTPLHLAINFKRPDAIQALIQAGAAVDAQDDCGLAPLHCAAIDGPRNAIDALLDAGAAVDVQDNNGRTPLHFAVKLGRLDAIDALLQDLNAVDAQDNNGQTPLHYAVRSEHLDAIQALLNAGAAIDAPDYNGQTPLHCAVRYEHFDAIEALIQAGAATDARDNYGRTPLQLAIEIKMPKDD